MNKKISILVVLALGSLGLFILQLSRQSDNVKVSTLSETVVNNEKNNEGSTTLDTKIIIEGLTKPWEIAFTDTGDLLYTEREGKLTRFSSEGRAYPVEGLPQINAGGEGGLLGLATDPAFVDNNYIFACYNTSSDVRVSRWVLRNDELSEETDIITSLPINTTSFPNRHSGCRLAFGPNDTLWVGTGDVAEARHPQSPESLGGKILRVDRDGNPVAGNLEAPFDSRIYSYGHRNVQGLAFTRQGEDFIGFSIEHGPSTDDEVNSLTPGNFGWDPAPPYDENVPMTDTQKFPNAVEALWSSGSPTLAPSGAAIIYGDEWGSLGGNLFVAMQKTMHIRMFEVLENGLLGEETKLFKDEFGRIRTVVQAPDGRVFFATDNGDGRDSIVQITPQ